MITKFIFSPATPREALDYAMAKNILPEAQRYGLFSEASPWEEMRSTAAFFGKWKTLKERKTLSVILSPADTDRVTPEQLAELEDVLYERFLSRFSGIGVVHYDKGEDSDKLHPIMHGHMVFSTVDIGTGKSFHLSPKEQRGIQDFVDDYVHSRFGWMVIDRATSQRKKAYEPKEPTSDSWVADLSVAVLNAFHNTRNRTFSMFWKELENQGILFVTHRKDGTKLQNPAFAFRWKDGDFHRIQGVRISPELSWKGIGKRFRESVPEQAASKTYNTARGMTKKMPWKGIALPQQASPAPMKAVDGGCLVCPDQAAMAAGKCRHCRNWKKAYGKSEMRGRER